LQVLIASGGQHASTFKHHHLESQLLHGAHLSTKNISNSCMKLKSWTAKLTNIHTKIHRIVLMYSEIAKNELF